MKIVELPTIDYIIELRKSMNITQPQLARAVDESRGTIARIESKKYEPKFSLIQKIYDYLHKKQNVPEKSLCTFGKRKIVSVIPSQTIDKAIDLIIKHDFECIPVIEHEIVRGKITTKKLATRRNSKQDSKIKVSDFMDEPPVIVPCSTPAIHVKPFLESASDCVILTKKGKLYGLVTLWDFLNQNDSR